MQTSVAPISTASCARRTISSGGEEVAFFLTVFATERIERAMLDAHVGEIDVAVDHIRDDLTNLTATHLVGHRTHRLEVEAIGLAQAQSRGPGEFLSSQRAVEDCTDFTVNMFKNSSQSVTCHSKCPSLFWSGWTSVLCRYLLVEFLGAGAQGRQQETGTIHVFG
jgi:hypothetical protein